MADAEDLQELTGVDQSLEHSRTLTDVEGAGAEPAAAQEGTVAPVGTTGRGRMKTCDMLARVRSAVTIGELPLAEKLTRLLLEQRPGSAALHNLLGNIYLRLGKPKEAVKELTDAIRLDEQFTDAYNNLAVVYKNANRLDQAEQLLLRALKIRADAPQLNYNLGNVYKRSGQNAKATTHYLKAIAGNPRPTSAYNNLGTIYETVGMLDEAVRTYRKGLQVDPNQPHIRYNLAVALEKAGAPGGSPGPARSGAAGTPRMA